MCLETKFQPFLLINNRDMSEPLDVPVIHLTFHRLYIKAVLFQIMSLALTPVLVGEQVEKLPYMNVAWLLPAIVGSIVTAFKVKVPG